MITIREEQMHEVHQRIVDEFEAECTEFIQSESPDWYARRPKAQVDSFVKSMIDFATSCNIRRGRNIQRLIFHEVYFEFMRNLSSFERYRLERSTLDEDYRVSQFINSLRTNQRKELELLSI
jgi:hypothetical protein